MNKKSALLIGFGMVVLFSLVGFHLAGKSALSWVAVGMGAFLLFGKKLFDENQNERPKPVEINFSRLKAHDLLKYLPWMKSLHSGHDEALSRLATSVARDLSQANPDKILGVHLLAGPEGTGKTHLSGLLGQALFGSSNTIIFDFKILDPVLFSEQFLTMLEQVNENPYQLIILENLESIQPGMMEPFLEIFQSSRWIHRITGQVTSFAACEILGIATVPASEEKPVAAFVDQRFLSYCSEVIRWGALPESVAAELAIGLFSSLRNQKILVSSGLLRRGASR